MPLYGNEINLSQSIISGLMMINFMLSAYINTLVLIGITNLKQSSKTGDNFSFYNLLNIFRAPKVIVYMLLIIVPVYSSTLAAISTASRLNTNEYNDLSEIRPQACFSCYC